MHKQIIHTSVEDFKCKQDQFESLITDLNWSSAFVPGKESKFVL